MPNKKGGKGYKKGKKSGPITRQLVIRDKKHYEEYGIIKSKLGNGRFSVNCQDGVDRMGIISGKMRKRVWVDVNTLVLITIWDFQESKCNIIHKYEDSDTQKLLNINELDEIFLNKNKNSEFDDSIDLSSESDGSECDEESDSEEEVNLDDI